MNYVKAVLDIICTGDYDRSVKFTDLDKSAEKTREELLDSVEEALTGSGGMNLPEETVKNFRTAMDHALKQCKYTVKEAVAVDDGFDVTVVIEPLVVM
jgi:hypothetical protein